MLRAVAEATGSAATREAPAAAVTGARSMSMTPPSVLNLNAYLMYALGKVAHAAAHGQAGGPRVTSLAPHRDDPAGRPRPADEDRSRVTARHERERPGEDRQRSRPHRPGGLRPRRDGPATRRRTAHPRRQDVPRRPERGDRLDGRRDPGPARRRGTRATGLPAPPGAQPPRTGTGRRGARTPGRRRADHAPGARTPRAGRLLRGRPDRLDAPRRGDRAARRRQATAPSARLHPPRRAQDRDPRRHGDEAPLQPARPAWYSTPRTRVSSSSPEPTPTRAPTTGSSPPSSAPRRAGRSPRGTTSAPRASSSTWTEHKSATASAPVPTRVRGPPPWRCVRSRRNPGGRGPRADGPSRCPCGTSRPGGPARPVRRGRGRCRRRGRGC